MSSLTKEQYERMEENRRKALERRAASQASALRNNSDSHSNSGISKQNTLSLNNLTVGKSIGSSFYNSSAKKKTEPQQPRFKGKSEYAETNSRSNIKQAHFSGKKVNGSCKLISMGRFTVDVQYNAQAIEIFKTIPSKQYDVTTRKWSFAINDHEKLIAALSSLRPSVCIGSLPSIVLKSLKKSEIYEPPSSIDLMNLDPLLLEAFLPFQREAVCFGVSRKGRVLIADDMGLGKTIQALGIAAYYREEWPLLIITPSSVRYSWAESIDKWIGSVTSEDITIINTSKDSLEGKIVIMTYDLLSRKSKEIENFNFKVVIMDESHMLKSFKAARYKAAAPLMKNANRLILLSGTPALSRPSELYTQISGIDKSLFPFFNEYGIRYCGGIQKPWGWDYSGSSNMEELQLILRSTIMIRRLKSEVIGQLPSKQRMTILLDSSLIKTKTKEMENALNHFQIIKGSEKHGALLQYFQKSAFAKVKAVCNYIEELLGDGKKFIAFAHHRIVLDKLCETCDKLNAKFIRIDGSTNAERRQKYVNDFQDDPDIKVALLSITAANTGITLTAAQLVVFAELFWNPGVLVQAEDRAHRIGQASSVLIQYLVAKDTADDYIWPLIQSKLDVLNKAGLSNSNFADSSSTIQKTKEDNTLFNYFSKMKTDELVTESASVEDSFWENYPLEEELLIGNLSKKRRMSPSAS